MNLLPNAYIIELVQVVAAVIGLLFSVWSLWDANKDRDALRAAGINGARSTLVRSNVRSELKNVLVFTFYLVAGVAGVLLPPPLNFNDDQVNAIVTLLREHQEVAWLANQQELAARIVRGVLIGATIVKMIVTALERYERQKYFTYIRQGEPKRRVSSESRPSDFPPPAA